MTDKESGRYLRTLLDVINGLHAELVECNNAAPLTEQQKLIMALELLVIAERKIRGIYATR